MKEIFALIILFLLLGFGVSLSPVREKTPNIFQGFSPASPIYSFLESDADQISESAPSINPYENLEFEARAAVVLDLQKDKIIFEKNGDLEWPLASLAKLATAGVIEDYLQLTEPFLRRAVITARAVAEEGDDGFLVGEFFNVADLRDAMLVKSSNDAAIALADWALSLDASLQDLSQFVNKMNLLASSLGLAKTYFLNPTGLDLDDRLSGAYGTANETAKLFSKLFQQKPEIFLATSRPSLILTSESGTKHVFESSAKELLLLPGLIAVKTGFTDLAGGNIVFAFNLSPSRQFIAVILGSSFNGRFTDAIKIYEATKNWISL